MNISRENIDNLNAVVSIQLEKEDYDERVVNTLKDYRRKARIDGFRPGKVPFGLISKMYRKPVLVEEINKLVSESLGKFIIEEKLNILGEPLPHKEESKTWDWDNDENFEFKFDLAIAPEFEVKISTKDKIPYYNIKVDDKLIDNYVENLASRFGEYKPTDKAEEKDTIKADIEQVTDGNQEEALKADDSSLLIDLIKDEKIKKDFIGKKAGDELTIDLRKAYPNDTELSGILKIDKEAASEIHGDFKIRIKEVSRFQNAEVGQELFDKVYGEGNVKSDKEFRERIAIEAKNGLKNDSEYKFKIDIKDHFIRKFKKDLPEEFLKRWLYNINEGKFTEEQIEKDFDHFTEDLKWQLIKDKITTDNSIEVNEEEIFQGAKDTARHQFMQYGMNNVPDEHLESFAKRILENKDEVRKLNEQVLENKIIQYIKENIKIDEKDISADKFNKMFEK